MSNEQGIGAPLGGRVHWLLWCLSPEFKGAYRLYYNYTYHRYLFYRIEKGAKSGNLSESGEAISARAEASKKSARKRKKQGYRGAPL